MRFVCVDGPEFDAHQVDFDNMMLRSKAFKEKEKHDHDCFIQEYGAKS
jgi:ferredoxin--NADP+ reductase